MANAKMVLEARLRAQYVDPLTGDKTFHPRADYARDKHGEPTAARTLIGGSQVFSTGPGGGPTVELNFQTFVALPEGKGGAFLARFLRSDPVERVRVEIIARPALENSDDVLADPGIRQLTAQEYMSTQAEMTGSSPVKTAKKGPGRPRKG